MEILPATTDDVDAVADLWVDLAADQRAHGSHLLAAANREAVRETVARRAVVDVLLVARASDADDVDGSEGRVASESGEGPIRGFVSAAVESGTYEQDVTRGVIDNLYVEPDARDRGVGGDLLAAAEAALLDAGVDAVALEVMADNAAARRFYERHGYEPHRVEVEKRSIENGGREGGGRGENGRDVAADGDR
ncbi:N-acetyltransferase [Haloparvum alkalitolerans]|uniref:GNAT family N-acetyltransferase n=1 Tax=Haloparvum alkalitolerans TaxID=1042953 RepID=UPI003CEC7F91